MYISDFFGIWKITEFMPTCLRGAVLLRHRVHAETLVPEQDCVGSVLFFGNKIGLEFYRPMRGKPRLVTGATAAVALRIDGAVGIGQNLEGILETNETLMNTMDKHGC